MTHVFKLCWSCIDVYHLLIVFFGVPQLRKCCPGFREPSFAVCLFVIKDLGVPGAIFLDSPYGEPKFAPPNQYFTDLRQMEANLQQIFIKISKKHKMQVPKIQGRHFLRKKNPVGRYTTSPRAWFHYLPLSATICRYLPLSAAICHYLPLSGAIWRYLPLFAVSLSTICRYLPLAIPPFAANSSKLPLFAAFCC